MWLCCLEAPRPSEDNECSGSGSGQEPLEPPAQDESTSPGGGGAGAVATGPCRSRQPSGGTSTGSHADSSSRKSPQALLRPSWSLDLESTLPQALGPYLPSGEKETLCTEPLKWKWWSTDLQTRLTSSASPPAARKSVKCVVTQTGQPRPSPGGHPGTSMSPHMPSPQSPLGPRQGSNWGRGLGGPSPPAGLGVGLESPRRPPCLSPQLSALPPPADGAYLRRQ